MKKEVAGNNIQLMTAQAKPRTDASLEYNKKMYYVFHHFSMNSTALALT